MAVTARKEQIMKHRVLHHLVAALVIGAVAVPLAHATTSGSRLGSGLYDGYKSSYPQLHAVLSHQVRAPLVPTANRGFDWRDAAVGAGTAAVTIFLIAGVALFLTRRVRVAI
jgi:hypothetical protein